jgi:hypothetical protein
MRQNNLASMSIEELWKLHEDLEAKLAAELVARRKLLEHRLKRLTKAQRESSAFRPTTSASAKNSPPLKTSLRGHAEKV